ncbi:hypothetical protein DFH07DRAFT_867738 [Mycena maculata]|uniref:G-patch domain-containing protein n=1 Tax=Mycena maculata TaxID=230809 RepID=A0AAD7JBZ0_9AGAR|nr:hypothetical protein DFH07DRAFT_867738 [Mycena maculata]
MPLDGHSYLVSQGWTGSGTGLRQGAISRPLAIPQKKTLAGLGKERDEAFPFWDHLFSAASKSIQIKISGDGSDSDGSDPEPNANISLKRTSTGILSNRRPVTGATAGSSGSTTPDVEDTPPRLSLLATAKREAAKRGLYSRFFRGPVLGPDSPASEPTIVADITTSAGTGEEAPKRKKRKVMEGEDEETRRERKRLRKEKKELKELKRAAKKFREEIKGMDKEIEGAVSNLEPPALEEKKKKEVGAAGEGKTVGKAKHKRKLDDEKRKEENRTVSSELNDNPSPEGKSKRKRKRPLE